MKTRSKRSRARETSPIRELQRQIRELSRTVHLLEEARSHYADQYDFAPYGCLTLDARGCIIELNITAAKLLGHDRARLVRMPFFPFVGKPHLHAFLVHLQRCKGSGEKVATEVALAVKGRSPRLVDLVSVPVADVHTGHTVYRTALLDVTEMRSLQRQVLEISEHEQARIGQDLHDGPCQTLTGIAFLAEAVAHELDSANSGLAAQIRDIARLGREGAEEVRLLAAGLFPVKVEHYGLAWALQELAAETSRRSATRCSFRMPVPIVITDHGAAIHLYRIAQEAVSNAVRHSHADEIVLDLAAGGGAVSLTIRDNGTGLPRQEKKSGLGLHTMRYRANMLGGSLEIGEAAPRGTAVVCSFPGKWVAHVETSRRKQEEDLPR